MRKLPAGIGARAHGEVGRKVLVLFRCVCVYRRGLGKRWSFWRENRLGSTVWVVRVWGYGTFGPWGLLRYFHEGRVVSQNFENMSHILAKFGLIGFDCLLDINEQIVPRFVLEFYSQLTFNHNSEGHFMVNFVIQRGHRDHVFVCLCHMLYYIKTSTLYNLAFFILKRMEKTQNKPKELLPYGMLLTRLFKHVVSIFPELVIDHYLLYDRVMHPVTPRYERKTRSDHGKKRPRNSDARSSSTTLNNSSSFHPLDDIVDENDEEYFRSNSFSPQNVSSSSNVVFRVRQNLPHESQRLNTYLSETINLQTQQRDDHRKGLRSIGKALKDMLSGKRK
nr:pentatricopeptide repeat-containing protein [Tanacetum cinerariifolium]